jgi:hypothetical protein
MESRYGGKSKVLFSCCFKIPQQIRKNSSTLPVILSNIRDLCSLYCFLAIWIHIRQSYNLFFVLVSSFDQYIESVPYFQAVCVRCFPCRAPVVVKSNPPGPLSSTMTTTSTHLEKIAIVWLRPKLALHLCIVQFINLSVGN